MTIIYAVESGEYSDYRVDALFSTRKDARLYVWAHGGEIVQRIVDPDMTQYRQGLKPYRVIIDASGHARDCDRTDPTLDHGMKDEANHFTHKDPAHCRDEWLFYVWAKNQKHAIKIANERRTQLIALNRWDTRKVKS